MSWLREQVGKLPSDLEQELKAYAKAAGYSELGIKEVIVSVRCLDRLTPDHTSFDRPLQSIRWQELIAAANTTYPDEMFHYHLALQRLAAQLARGWSSGWRKLQELLVIAEIARADNPLETLLDVAMHDDLEPWQLDREWAWVHERSLRPDLRRKWNRAVRNFDKLRSLPQLLGTTLMPANRIGPMPRKGERLKNAHYPLPRQFEAALEGEGKQVMEAAHFLYRCLRELGIYRRGEDPSTDDLLADEALKVVMTEQRFMSAGAARLHIARLRNWRESRFTFE